MAEMYWVWIGTTKVQMRLWSVSYTHLDVYKRQQYVRAQSLDEAYELYQKKPNFVLGGMLWLKMKNKTLGITRSSTTTARPPVHGLNRMATVLCSCPACLTK